MGDGFFEGFFFYRGEVGREWIMDKSGVGDKFYWDLGLLGVVIVVVRFFGLGSDSEVLRGILVFDRGFFFIKDIVKI